VDTEDGSRSKECFVLEIGTRRIFDVVVVTCDTVVVAATRGL